MTFKLTRHAACAVAAAGITAAAVLGLQAPALAAGRFDWGADLTHAISSRGWINTGDGTVKVKSACRNTGEKYSIYLVQGGNNKLGTHTYTCTGTIETHLWTKTHKGVQYNFVILRAHQYDTAMHFSGSVFYP